LTGSITEVAVAPVGLGERSPLLKRAVRAPVRLLCRHHNKIQFFGYEVANVVLLAHQATGIATRGVDAESCAVGSFLTGAACIYAFDPDRRPWLLFYAGMALTAGGLFLAAAGYVLTGLSVALASLETARGGLMALRGTVAARRSAGLPVTAAARLTEAVGGRLLGPYAATVRALCRRSDAVGRFVDGRPFLTSSMIKLPLRLDFIAKKLAAGDLIGTGVGLSWMLLGDGALALNDGPFKRRILRWVGSETE
jgi:hypothetical protein